MSWKKTSENLDFNLISWKINHFYTSIHVIYFVNSFTFFHAPGGILVPWPKIKPVPSVVEAWSLSHWSTREVARCIFLSLLFFWMYNFASEGNLIETKEWGSESGKCFLPLLAFHSLHTPDAFHWIPSASVGLFPSCPSAYTLNSLTDLCLSCSPSLVTAENLFSTCIWLSLLLPLNNICCVRIVFQESFPLRRQASCRLLCLNDRAFNSSAVPLVSLTNSEQRFGIFSTGFLSLKLKGKCLCEPSFWGSRRSLVFQTTSLLGGSGRGWCSTFSEVKMSLRGVLIFLGWFSFDTISPVGLKMLAQFFTHTHTHIHTRWHRPPIFPNAKPGDLSWASEARALCPGLCGMVGRGLVQVALASLPTLSLFPLPLLLSSPYGSPTLISFSL